MSANYRDTSVDHKLYTFYGNARHYNRIGLIPRNQQVDFKYCETCNICYKKSYFNGHKKNKFHKEKQNVLDDARDKRLTEYSLSHTINHCLHIQLKNNDLNIGDIICDYLKATCFDCKGVTSNPTTIFGRLYINNIAVLQNHNICQHCHGKYKLCCGDGCDWFKKETGFHNCENCEQFGCIQHIKKIGKKYKCIDCAHNEVDTIFGKEVTQNEEIINLKARVKSQKQHMNYRAKKITKKSKENTRLKNELIDKNERIRAKDQEIIDLRKN